MMLSMVVVIGWVTLLKSCRLAFLLFKSGHVQYMYAEIEFTGIHYCFQQMTTTKTLPSVLDMESYRELSMRDGHEASDHGLEFFGELEDPKEDDPVDDHHSEKNPEVSPLGVTHLDLPDISQYLLTTDKALPCRMNVPGKHQPLEFILVQTLVRILVEGNVV